MPQGSLRIAALRALETQLRDMIVLTRRMGLPEVARHLKAARHDLEIEEARQFSTRRPAATNVTINADGATRRRD
ncbi:hypothetical protein [Mangrovibrevibacter kandeliae]|uniref:hypothetical protein n=1 Tax=Mangrovibrevibacter kandeliae TaxID=2968473 RepID=UPI002117E7A9|nr:MULTISPECIES: hypothetical protein [unclassified Aurantimonas]MCQ8783330.1 hypothetical protein [Aurantimonas sp. CSK15Z-1]MCW4116156.1 hypothetical protein [Aurantimonas sp. MSK8Z-1]